MLNKPKILCVILARGGSKAIPGKNIKHINGHPLIAYTIIEALQSKYIDRVIVSSDSKEIKEQYEIAFPINEKTIFYPKKNRK